MQSKPGSTSPTSGLTAADPLRSSVWTYANLNTAEAKATRRAPDGHGWHGRNKAATPMQRCGATNTSRRRNPPACQSRNTTGERGERKREKPEMRPRMRIKRSYLKPSYPSKRSTCPSALAMPSHPLHHRRLAPHAGNRVLPPDMLGGRPHGLSGPSEDGHGRPSNGCGK